MQDCIQDVQAIYFWYLVINKPLTTMTMLRANDIREHRVLCDIHFVFVIWVERHHFRSKCRNKYIHYSGFTMPWQKGLWKHVRGDHISVKYFSSVAGSDSSDNKRQQSMNSSPSSTFAHQQDKVHTSTGWDAKSNGLIIMEIHWVKLQNLSFHVLIIIITT